MQPHPLPDLVCSHTPSPCLPSATESRRLSVALRRVLNAPKEAFCKGSEGYERTLKYKPLPMSHYGATENRRLSVALRRVLNAPKEALFKGSEGYGRTLKNKPLPMSHYGATESCRLSVALRKVIDVPAGGACRIMQEPAGASCRILHGHKDQRGMVILAVP